MDILVGRGGNQGLVIEDENVSKIHCKIEILDSGRMTVTNLSVKGTWLNGDKLVKRTLVKPDDELRLGTSFTVRVKDLLVQENYNAYTNYLYIADRYKSKDDLEAFINTAAKHSVSQMPGYVMPVVKSTLAYYDIQEGRLYDAQTLLYDVGDQLYEMQDGSELLQGIYASVLDLIGKLYVEVGKYDEAKIAADAATKIFRRIKPGQISSSEKQIESAALLAESVDFVLSAN
jgi:tetratricopeptide (TPR) repeat protein